MIPLPYAGPRLYAELALVALLVVASGTAVTYRALYKAAGSEADARLSSASSEAARQTAEALHLSYSERMRQVEEDRARSDAAARDAVARARRAETALNQMRRDLDAEALEDACVGRPLSERTRERLRRLESDYSRAGDPVRAGADPG